MSHTTKNTICNPNRGAIQMKNLIIIAALTTAAPSFAEKEMSNAEFCDLYSEAAYVTMKSHQKGIPLSSTLGKVRKVVTNSSVYEIYEDLIMEAYDAPRYRTKFNQERESAEFRDRKALLCLKVRRSHE